MSYLFVQVDGEVKKADTASRVPTVIYFDISSVILYFAFKKAPSGAFSHIAFEYHNGRNGINYVFAFLSSDIVFAEYSVG